MEWHELFDSLAGRLQEGWPQVVRTIQDGDFGELLQQPAMIMAAAGLLQLAALMVLVRMKLLGPVLKFTGFVLIAGIVHQGVHALVVPKRGVSELSP